MTPISRLGAFAALTSTLVCALAMALAAPAWAGEWTGYVTTLDPPRVVPFSTADNTTAAPIALANPPRDIAIAPDGGTIYVLVGHPDRLIPIDAATGTPGDPVPLPGPASVLAITPDGSAAYAAIVNLGEVYRIDLDTGALSSPISVGHRVWGLAIHPGGGSAFVATGDSGGVSRIDLTSGVVSRVGSTGGVMDGIAFRPDGLIAYATSSAFNTVYPVSVPVGAPAEIGSSFNAGHQASELAITPDGAKALVVNFSQDQVTALDLEQRKGTTIAVGSTPSDVAITPDGKTGYVANEDSGDVTPVDIAEKSAGSPIPIGTDVTPLWIAITPNQPPRAKLSAGPAWTGAPVRLDASASVDADGSISRYEWDFGDGATTFTTTPVVDHAYAKGTYTATVTLTDDSGCSTEIVFTGQTASCNGSADAATAELTLNVTDEPPTPPAPPADGDDGPDGGGSKGGKAGRARLGALRVLPRNRAARAGSALRFRVRVRNSGGKASGPLRLCVRAPRRLIVPTRCRRVRSVAAGRTVRQSLRLRLRRGAPAGRRAAIRFKITGKGLKARTAKAVVRIRR